jgi:hypothetical protein
LPEYRLEAEWNMQLQPMYGQREYNIYKGKRNILGQVVIPFWKKTK